MGSGGRTGAEMTSETDAGVRVGAETGAETIEQAKEGATSAVRGVDSIIRAGEVRRGDGFRGSRGPSFPTAAPGGRSTRRVPVGRDIEPLDRARGGGICRRTLGRFVPVAGGPVMALLLFVASNRGEPVG